MRCTYNLHDFFLVQDVQCDEDKIYVVGKRREDGTYYYLTVDLRTHKKEKHIALGYPYFGRELFSEEAVKYLASPLYDFRVGRYGYNMCFLEDGYIQLERSEDNAVCPVYLCGDRPNFFVAAGHWSYRSEKGIVTDVMTGEKNEYLPAADFYYSHHNYLCYLMTERGEQKLVVHTFPTVISH
jgi:hypothetical protein